MNKIKMLFLIFVSISCSFATIGKYDVYIAYSQELDFRAGVNLKNYGVYFRPIFDQNSYDYFPSHVNRKGLEAGLNLNKTLFIYKSAEVILNAYAGFDLSRVNRLSDNLIFWEKSARFGFIPEIRLFKKASITLSPLYGLYFWPIDEINNISTSALRVPDMSLWQMSLGFKFYY